VNILDENIIKSQRQLLKSWRIRIRQIGYEVGRRGIKDDEIIPLLLELRRATFFTRDLGFNERSLCHKRYCLVCMAVEKHEAACLHTPVASSRGIRHASETNGHSHPCLAKRSFRMASSCKNRTILLLGRLTVNECERGRP